MTNAAAGAGVARRWGPRLAVFAALATAAAVLRFTLVAPKPAEVRVAAVERGRVEATLTKKAGTVPRRGAPQGFT